MFMNNGDKRKGILLKIIEINKQRLASKSKHIILLNDMISKYR